MIKVAAPKVALDVLDRAIQAYGGMGVCQDTPLSTLWAQSRTLRLAVCEIAESDGRGC